MAIDNVFEKIFEEGDVRRDAWTLLKKVGDCSAITKEDADTLAKYYVETRMATLGRVQSILSDDHNVINSLAVDIMSVYEPASIEEAIVNLKKSYTDVMELYLTLDLLRWLEKIGNVSEPLKVEFKEKQDAREDS